MLKKIKGKKGHLQNIHDSVLIQLISVKKLNKNKTTVSTFQPNRYKLELALLATTASLEFSGKVIMFYLNKSLHTPIYLQYLSIWHLFC